MKEEKQDRLPTRELNGSPKISKPKMDLLDGSLNRRDFLRVSGSTIAIGGALSIFPNSALALAASSPQPKMPPAPANIALPSTKASSEGDDAKAELGLPTEERIGFAIIGLGNISVGQAMPAINQSHRAKITALVSGSPDKAKKIAHAYGIPENRIFAYENLEAISKLSDVHAVYVGTPNSTHKDFTVRSAQAGKHVLCEKPMSTSVSDAEAMIAACKKAKVKLMIAYRQQYEPYNTVLKQMVQEKTYGKTRLYHAHFGQVMGDPAQWRLNKKLAGGGPMPDVGIYCLNACRFHTGLDPVEVFAWTQESPNDKRFREVEESIAWQMRFPDGMLAHCSASYNVHQVGFFRYQAEKAWFGMSPAFSYHGGKLEMAYPDQAIDVVQQPFLAEKNQFVLEFEHFCQAVIENKEIQSPGEEGLKDMRVIEAIYKSAKAGQPVHVKV